MKNYKKTGRNRKRKKKGKKKKKREKMSRGIFQLMGLACMGNAFMIPIMKMVQRLVLVLSQMKTSLVYFQ